MSANIKSIFDIEFLSPSNFPTEFTEFERNREPIIDALRKAAGDNSFDEADAWGALRHTASWYFRRTKTKKHVLRPAQRVELLIELAQTLREARNLLHAAMSDDVGWDLMREWCNEAKISLDAAAIPLKDGQLSFEVKLRTLITELTLLERAGKTAGARFRTHAGTPSGAGILTAEDVKALQAIYRKYTGKESELKAGPFADFVQLFLGAVGRTADTSQDYVFEAFKYLKRKTRRAVAG